MLILRDKFVILHFNIYLYSYRNIYFHRASWCIIIIIYTISDIIILISNLYIALYNTLKMAGKFTRRNA